MAQPKSGGQVSLLSLDKFYNNICKSAILSRKPKLIHIFSKLRRRNSWKRILEPVRYCCRFPEMLRQQSDRERQWDKKYLENVEQYPGELPDHQQINILLGGDFVAVDKKGKQLPPGIRQRANGRYEGRVKVEYRSYSVYADTITETKKKMRGSISWIMVFLLRKRKSLWTNGIRPGWCNTRKIA